MTSRSGWGGFRKGSGRKRLPTEQRRKHRVTIFVTDSELAGLTRLARKHGHSVGTITYALVALGLSRSAPRKPRKEGI